MDLLVFVVLLSTAMILAVLSIAGRLSVLSIISGVLFILIGIYSSSTGMSYQTGLNETNSFANSTSFDFNATGDFTGSHMTPQLNATSTAYYYTNEKNDYTQAFSIMFMLLGLALSYDGMLYLLNVKKTG